MIVVTVVANGGTNALIAVDFDAEQVIFFPIEGDNITVVENDYQDNFQTVLKSSYVGLQIADSLKEFLGE